MECETCKVPMEIANEPLVWFMGKGDDGRSIKYPVYELTCPKCNKQIQEEALDEAVDYTLPAQAQTEGVDTEMPEITMESLEAIVSKIAPSTHILFYLPRWMEFIRSIAYPPFNFRVKPTLFGLRVIIVSKRELPGFSPEIQDMLIKGKPVVLRLPQGI